MEMTKNEIVAEYKAAKQPMKQIGILADQNLCSKRQIVDILLEAGCSVPGQYAPKPKKDALKELQKEVAQRPNNTKAALNAIIADLDMFAAILRGLAEVEGPLLDSMIEINLDAQAEAFFEDVRQFKNGELI